MVLISHTRRYTLDEVLHVAQGEEVRLDPVTAAELDRRRAQIMDKVRADPSVPAYGFNRGFGHNVDLPVQPAFLAELQRNLLISHAAGMGAPMPREVVRAAMFMRAVSLAWGHSGVRSVIVGFLVEMLNRGVTPLVPAWGSVGASGDLAPLSHIAALLLGEGEAWVGNRATQDISDSPPLPGREALRLAGLEPLALEMKEGLALNNGLQFSCALGILSWFRVMGLLKTASLATAISAQVMLASDSPFDPRLHALRQHPGALRVARWIWELMGGAENAEDCGSPICKAHAHYDIDGEVQDPYSIRCAAQILGACMDLVDEAGRTFEIELNSVTDNPVLLEKDGRYTTIISGGHFHGMPVAVKIYGLFQAIGIMARLSNMRCARYVDERRNKGLGSDLKWPGLDPDTDSVSSGMMIPEYASAALTNAIWGAAMPSHLFSLSTDCGQEDHVSMSAPLAVRLWETLPRLAEVLAIELAFAAQAASIRLEKDGIPSKILLSTDQWETVGAECHALEEALRATVRGGKFRVECDVRLVYGLEEEERHLSPPCERACTEIRKTFPRVEADRYLSGELRELARRVEDGSILAEVEKMLRLQ